MFVNNYNRRYKTAKSRKRQSRSLATRVSDLIGTVLALDLHGEGLGPCGSQPDDLIGSRALCVSASFVLTVWLSGQPAQQF